MPIRKHIVIMDEDEFDGMKLDLKCALDNLEKIPTEHYYKNEVRRFINNVMDTINSAEEID